IWTPFLRHKISRISGPLAKVFWDRASGLGRRYSTARVSKRLTDQSAACLRARYCTGLRCADEVITKEGPALRAAGPCSLGKTGIGGAAHDRAFLASGDQAVLFQLVCQVRDATHEAAMIARVGGASPNHVGDCAAGVRPGREESIRHAGVATVNNDRGTAIRIWTAVHFV